MSASSIKHVWTLESPDLLLGIFLKRYLLFFWFTVLSISAGCTLAPVSPAINAKPLPTQESPYIFQIPEIPDQQDLIPLNLYFHRPLTRGDRVAIKVNSGRAVAFELIVEGDYEITAFGGRIRTEGTGPIYCQVTRSNGELVTIAKNVKIQIAHHDSILRIPETLSGTNEIRSRYGGGRFGFMFRVENNMAKRGYIREILLKSASGTMKLTLSPYTAANPVFVFDTRTPLADLKINVIQ